jgi:hypothetical protein
MLRFFTILSVFLFFSCTKKTSSEIESDQVGNTIDLTAGFDNIHSVRLSEIADSVTFIPFETTPQSLMGLGQRNMIFSPQYIFYYDMYFDWKGNYLGSIVKRGQGPFEEIDGGHLLFKDNHFYSKGSKFIEYDKTGKPTGKVRYLYDAREFEASNFLRWGTAFFSVGENFAVYDYPTTMYFFNKDTGKTTRVKGNGFVDDLLGMDFFYPQLGIFEEKMITYIWPHELLDYIEKCKDRGKEANSRLIALSKQVKADDNYRHLLTVL